MENNNNSNGNNVPHYDRFEDQLEELELTYGGYTLNQLKNDLSLEELAPIALRSSNTLLSGITKTGNYKINPPLMVYIFRLVEKGLSFEDAAKLAGVSARQMYDWRKRGKKLEYKSEVGEIDLADCSILEQYSYLFYLGMEQAVANRKLKLLGKIESAADDPKFWTAAAWMLERAHPEEFGQRLRVEQVDWRSELIDLIKSGLDFEVIAENVGEEETRELFESAGVTIDAPRLGEGSS